MKPIKKFSMIYGAETAIVESLKNKYGEGVLDLVKKLGYGSLEEIAKEKKLLSKLESLLKDLPKRANVSEDEAEEIEKKELELGEPKSLEGEAEEEEGPGNPSDEVAEEEDSAEEIEDAELELGEPEEQPEEEGEEKVSDDQEIEKEVPAEADEVEDKDGVEKAEEEEETPEATRRIKTFEDFIDEDGDGSTSTIIKKVRYSDDATEPEDYGVPVAASADPMAEDSHYDGEKRGEDDEHKGDEDEDRGDKKVDDEDDKEKADHYKGAVKSDDKEIDALKKDKDYDEKEEEEAEKNESRLHVLSFDGFVNEKYDKVVWGGDEGDKSKTDPGEEDYEDEDKKEEKYDKVVWGGDAGDKSKTEPGKVDYPEDEEEKDEAVKNEKFDDVVLGGNKGDKSKTDPGEEDYEDEDKKEEKFDDVTLGGNKGDKSKTDPGEEDYEDEDKKDEDCGEDHEDDKKEESVTEETDEMEAKEETIEDEVKDEESGAAGEAIPVAKGDGPESAAGIAAGDMERGKPKEKSEELGAGFVTKEQPVEEEPETSPDDVGTEEGGKVVTSVPDSDVSENLTKKQEKLPEGLKRAILKRAGKTDAEIEEALNRMNEKEITSDDEFSDYALEVLKQAHGDDFDQAKADEVINGLKDKYKGDYGAMVGALQSSMG